MANKGVAPADLTTDVGRLRAILGDMDYVPLDPPEAGFGDYGMYSDGELSVFLGQGESVEGGAYFAYMQMAAAAAIAEVFGVQRVMKLLRHTESILAAAFSIAVSFSVIFIVSTAMMLMLGGNLTAA